MIEVPIVDAQTTMLLHRRGERESLSTATTHLDYGDAFPAQYFSEPNRLRLNAAYRNGQSRTGEGLTVTLELPRSLAQCRTCAAELAFNQFVGSNIENVDDAPGAPMLTLDLMAECHARTDQRFFDLTSFISRPADLTKRFHAIQ
jgi:hypothetical protein